MVKRPRRTKKTRMEYRKEHATMTKGSEKRMPILPLD